MNTPFEIADAARADIADLLDQQLSPLGLAAIDELAPASGETILDVGCGAGGSVLQLAERVGENGHVTGVDIGPRSLSVARTRTAHLTQVTLRQEDAAQLGLPAQSLDAVYSRFGVMFFDDPVSAFSNFKRMLRPGGRIAFVCWRALNDNELDLLPLQAAELNIAADETPFSFERTDAIQKILEDAGLTSISIRKFDASVSCGSLDDTVKVSTTVGALGKILRDNPELLEQTTPRVRSALRSRQSNSGVQLRAATWLVSAVRE